MMNPLDRVIGWLSPSAGLRRHRARQMLQARAYEGASRKDGWTPRRGGASANADHMADAAELRRRARALVQNVPYIAKGMSSLVANAVGTGIVPTAQGPAAERLQSLWSAWAKVCDADGRLDLYGIQAAAYRAMEQDGEVLIRLRPRRVEDGLPVPLQLQLLEIDWLDSGKTQTTGNNQIVNGIEYDAIGRVVAYWLLPSHPGDVLLPRGALSQSKRVPAESIIHLYNPERPGQGRGFTRLAPVIARVRDLQLYEDAELQRKNLETRLSVLASGDVSAMAFGDANAAADATTARQTGELGTLSSASIIELPAGTNVTTVEPKPAGGYTDYVKYQLHLIAAGMGVTYEMLTGDVREVNFSSARVNLLEFRRNADLMRWLVLVPRLCEPIWRSFVDAAVTSGAVRRGEHGVEWSAPRWDYVNPQQDVEADVAEISAGLSSVSEKLRQRGYKPELVFTELAADVNRFRELGLLDTLMTWRPKNGTTPAPARSEAAEVAREMAAFAGRALEGVADGVARQVTDLAGRAIEGVAAVAARPQTIEVIQSPTMVHVETVPAQPARREITRDERGLVTSIEEVRQPVEFAPMRRTIERDENGLIATIRDEAGR